MKPTIYECVECFDVRSGIPVVDETEVFYIGVEKARTWCSNACYDASRDRKELR